MSKELDVSQELEYRLLKFKLDKDLVLVSDLDQEADIVSHLFDFGCTAIVQDHHEAFMASDGAIRSVDFASNLVAEVLYRMLRNKVVNFKKVYSISPDTVAVLFMQFMDWYNIDIEYLGNLLKKANPSGINTSSGGSSGGDNTFYFSACSLAEGLHKSLQEIYEWSFEDIALLMYRGKVKEVNEYFDKMLK